LETLAQGVENAVELSSLLVSDTHAGAEVAVAKARGLTEAT